MSWKAAALVQRLWQVLPVRVAAELGLKKSK